MFGHGKCQVQIQLSLSSLFTHGSGASIFRDFSYFFGRIGNLGFDYLLTLDDLVFEIDTRGESASTYMNVSVTVLEIAQQFAELNITKLVSNICLDSFSWKLILTPPPHLSSKIDSNDNPYTHLVYAFSFVSFQCMHANLTPRRCFLI